MAILAGWLNSLALLSSGSTELLENGPLSWVGFITIIVTWKFWGYTGFTGKSGKCIG